ncbi:MULTISPECIES: SHOCT domain-containing protein [unclassified Streptomyces]|uniref:SHOCT domain-containing protein n=1 Tax=unclassified Streptomyces TaxID=2593676 RepID=UPI00224CB1A2|nr:MULTISPECIES: SHOCT domain-containing protein [unclassified Streptomyces]WSF88419.1 SHOCT domain-containing protein [Streptomyces sp. NBC_01744]MCX5314558.1 SHOCT domain-containing protein [Streptomyces sp. NBC_00154]WSC35380.1 SHOCT domain-containing protein [Streptomyces sp. NBC_01763]WSC57318.1 SHOCT domain-containing protein [Streptomyces sp. NBC_01761]WSJ54659.1 SHOCT domain-containing protein [Streptomyces sp. NBC_01318]
MSAQTYLAYDYPLLGAFWTMLWIFLWIMWFVLLFRIFTDIFRDDTMSGWVKTGWLVLCIVLPFLGVFVYVIARGRNMGHREAAHARAQREEFNAYIRKTAADGRSSSVDELARLSEIRDRGGITDEEFRRAKELVLTGHGSPAEHAGPTSASGH